MAELNYFIIEIEALAGLWAVRELNVILRGGHFEIKTDNKPLKEAFTKKGIDLNSSRIHRWMVALHKFDFILSYIPGAKKC